MSRSQGRCKRLVLTTEIFSVRTDIPSPMVLCVLPEASCGQRCLLRSHKGEPTLPPSMPAVSTPIVYLRYSHILSADMAVTASPPVVTHHLMKGGERYGG